MIRDSIDDGMLYDIDFEQVDTKIIAQLIKLWYRECPILVLDGINEEMIEQVETITDAQGIIDIMKEPNLSYFYWLIDLCLEIGKYADINLMNHKNMAVVLAPNLYDIENVQSMTFPSSVIQFMSLCIDLRNEQKQLEEANKIIDDSANVFDGNNETHLDLFSNDQISTPSKPDIPL